MVYIYIHIIREALGKFEWWKQNIYILSHGVFLYVFLQKMRSSYQQQQYAFFLLGVHCQVAKIPANRAWEAPKVCWDRPLQRFSCECHWHGPSVSGMSPWVFWNDQGKRGRRGEVWKNRWCCRKQMKPQPSTTISKQCFWYVLSVWCLHLRVLKMIAEGNNLIEKHVSWDADWAAQLRHDLFWGAIGWHHSLHFLTYKPLSMNLLQLPKNCHLQMLKPFIGDGNESYLIIWKNVCCQQKPKNNRNHQLSRVQNSVVALYCVIDRDSLFMDHAGFQTLLRWTFLALCL